MHNANYSRGDGKQGSESKVCKNLIEAEKYERDKHFDARVSAHADTQVSTHIDTHVSTHADTHVDTHV